MVWRQHELTLPPFKRGCHLITGLSGWEGGSGKALPRQAVAGAWAGSKAEHVSPGLALAASSTACGVCCADIIAREAASSLREVKVGLAHVFSEWRRQHPGMPGGWCC